MQAYSGPSQRIHQHLNFSFDSAHNAVSSSYRSCLIFSSIPSLSLKVDLFSFVFSTPLSPSHLHVLATKLKSHTPVANYISPRNTHLPPLLPSHMHKHSIHFMRYYFSHALGTLSKTILSTLHPSPFLDP